MTSEKLSRYRWVILFAAWFTFCASYLPRLAIPPLIPVLMDQYGLTNTQAGLLMTSFWVSYFLLQLPAGVVSDRIGARKTHVIMSALTGILCLATGFARTYPELLITRFLNGAVAGFIFAPGQALVLKWFGEKERSAASGLYITASYVGSFIPMVLAPVIANDLGSWRYAFWILAVFPFAASILVSLTVKERPGSSSQRAKADTYSQAVSGARSSPTSVLRNKFLWYSCLGSFAVSFAWFGGITWAPKYIIDQTHSTVVYAGLISSLMTITGLFGSSIGGVLADRVFKKKAVIIVTGMVVTGLTLVLIGIGWTMTILLVTLCFASYGFFNSVTVGPTYGLLGDFGFDRRLYGTAAGFSNFMAQMGGALSPLLFGLILDATGTYVYGWLMLGFVITAISLFPALLVKKGF